jgi:hypothetical protein
MAGSRATVQRFTQITLRQSILTITGVTASKQTVECDNPLADTNQIGTRDGTPAHRTE